MSEAHAEFFKAIKAQLYALQNQVDTLEKEFNSAVAERDVLKDEVTKLKGDNLALHPAMGHSGDSVMGQAEVAQHQLLEAQRLLSSILYDIQTNPCTYFCLREVVVELGSYGTPEWSVMLTSTNTYPYMRVRSKGKPAPNGVYIINEMITKMSVRVNYI